ncbi:MAG: hypothetical protein M3401_08125 [Actinomycetota bacterium]|nr:hypothetical protein [Actinomycetota bacterium]
MPRPRRLVSVLAALLAMAGLSACGKHPNKDARVVHAEMEGLYLDVGELKYQVQVSRLMNPYDTQDKGLLTGVPEAERELEPDETWFGIFLRVQNETDKELLPASEIELVDTLENVFKPVELEPTNVFAYRADEPIPPRQVIPLPNSAAYDTPGQGALILYKLKNGTLDNRPLELKIDNRQLPPQTGLIALDL